MFVDTDCTGKSLYFPVFHCHCAISGIFNPINPSFRDLTDISDHFLINNSDNIAGLFLFRFKGFTKIYYEHFERGGLFRIIKLEFK